jgi:hypothetical protein
MMTTPDHNPPKSRQRGQATTEFVVLALALVPLFIVVPLIGKYIDLNQAAEQSSRYVAFEAAARNTSNSWKTDAELATEVRRRFFSNSDAPIKTNDVAGDFSAHRNPIWTNHNGAPLLDKFETSVGVKGDVSGLNAIAATAPFRGMLDLSNDNLYTGTVTLKIADIANFKPFDKIALATSRKTVLLADAWTARGATSIRDKIEGAPAMYPAAAIKAVIDLAGDLPPLIYDPAMRVGNFDWDVVPCDRLIGGC